MGQLAFSVYSEEPKVRRAVVERLEETGQATVVARISDPRRLAEALSAGGVDGIYIDLGSDPNRILDLIEGAGPTRPVLLVGGRADDPSLILRAMRMGVREFFPNNETSEILGNVVGRLLVEALPVRARRAHGRLVAVTGAKGGVGATFVTCQLAAALRQLGRSVAVVDLNLHSGDVALQLDLKPTHTLADLVRKEGEIDSTYLGTLAQLHASGVAVLAAPTGPEEAEGIGPQHVTTALELLRQDFDVVVADVARSWDSVSLAALDAADDVIVVTSLEVPSLTRTRETLRLLPRLGFVQENLHVVVNRSGSANAVSARELGEFLGQAADFQLPNDWEAASEAINQGRTLARIAAGARIDRAFRQLAEGVLDWAGLAPATAPPDEAPLVRRLRSRLQRVWHGSE